jgi:hypothetical protein
MRRTGEFVSGDELVQIMRHYEHGNRDDAYDLIRMIAKKKGMDPDGNYGIIDWGEIIEE